MDIIYKATRIIYTYIMLLLLIFICVYHRNIIME